VNAIASSLSSVGYLGPLFLRVGVGVVMAWHGWQKLDGGVSNFAGFVESLGIPAPTLTAYVVTVIELVGGTALIFGVLTRVAASLIAIEMALTGFWVKPSKLQAPFMGTEGGANGRRSCACAPRAWEAVGGPCDRFRSSNRRGATRIYGGSLGRSDLSLRAQFRRAVIPVE
jgi:uncharacterized membrane protein YphA (DoxX/SURF4 family)